ncbi:DUF6689 family protein [Vulcaniibacterium gelatinicum]|uniref:DUF6689 family protein n=1 Tax=Vulcaniibacterium gelatinicum TaxID=2598725 RepID=UPI0011C82CEC|nr:DUF6689 family protein [Vulcaniibacterium gelatinicum]
MRSPGFFSRFLLAAGLLAGGAAASAQSLPVTVDVAGKTATVVVGLPSAPLADLTLTFDDVSGLTPASLGVNAQLVNLGDPALLARLPDPQLTSLDSSLPLLITIEPPALGGLSFRRSGRIELHTHALAYALGSSYRLLKAPLGGNFVDITDEVAPGSVRARGTYGGFSQFLIVADLRPTSSVVAAKIAALRARVDRLPAAEQPAFDAWLDTAEAAVASGAYADAIAAVDAFRARASERAGTAIADQWRATRDVENHAGELIAGAATLRFSIAYLRDYGD